VPIVFKDLAENAGPKEAIEFVADRHWFVGSPDTVAQKILAFADSIGGPWGTTMLFGYDYSQNPGPWLRSLELLAKEVGPRLAAAFDKRAAR
jgi:alkanesulfonate monooxygenase SsuD/methylene tetrahydromethanopterin reductase-like flavin-dependent oxidoreductase (luciferase family)